MQTPVGSINIIKPAEHQAFKKGEPITIEAKLNANVQLHGYTIFIATAEGDTLYKKEEHAHQSELTIQESWIDTSSAPVHLKLVVSTALDHHGNDLEKSVSFKVQ